MANVRKVDRARGWMLTAPGPGEEHGWTKEELEEQLAPYPYQGQLERGAEKSEQHPDGYLHWQIYVEANNPVKWTTLKKKLPGVHIEPRYATKQQALDYVSKLETSEGVFLSNPVLGSPKVEDNRRRDTWLEKFTAQLEEGWSVDEVVLNDPNALRYRTQLLAWKQAWDRKNTPNWRPVKVYYLWGETGLGKTRSLREHYAGDFYEVVDYNSDRSFDSYDGQSCVILDEFYGEEAEEMGFSKNYLLKILDGYSGDLKARYAPKFKQWDTVWIVSNVPFEAQYANLQRSNPARYRAFKRRFTGGIYGWDEFKEKFSWAVDAEEERKEFDLAA